MIEVPLGQWLPDAPDLKNPGLKVAKGCYPSAAGYYPFWSAEAGSENVTGTMLGAKRFERTDGSEVICVGTNTDLWVLTGGTATASSLALTSINTDETWTFEQFGTAVYATIKSIDADGRQSYYLTDIDSDTSFSASPGTPPAGNALGRIDDFLVYGDLEDIDDSNAPTRVRWSAFNNPQATWGTDIATQMGYYDMPDYWGAVTAIAGGSVGYVMQRHATSLFDYTGSATAFQRVLLDGAEDQSAGSVGQPSLATVGGVHYWLSDIGFCRLTGGSIQIISKARVWDFFLETANTEKLHKVQAAVNMDRRCIVWNCYQVDTTAYNFQMIYNWEVDEWSYALQTIDWLVPTVYDGSFDEGEVRKRRVLGGFSSGTWQELTGTAIEAVLETGDFQLEPGRRAFVSGVRPIVENVDANTKVSLRYRDIQGAAATATTSTAVGALGYLGVNVDARYFSVEITIPAAADWDKASAVQIDAMPSGLT